MPRADLTVLCWEGYEYPSLLDPFAAEHGVTAHGEAHVSDRAAADRLVAGESAAWDVVNLNNPFARDMLHPRGLIAELDATRFRPEVERWLPQFADLYQSAESEDGGALIGICQRFGSFNLVVNTDRISRATAEDQGFRLIDDARHAGRYGVLEYDDFNVFHICIGAGLDPFAPQSDTGLIDFAAMARRWFEGTAMVTADHLAMNRALVDGEIDFYLSGGVFSASPARLDGHDNIRAITPKRGPIDGKGAISFAEVTSVVANGRSPDLAEDFLAHLLRPEVAVAVAMSSNTINPVVQMADPKVMAAFGAAHLAAIQWDSLEEDMACCAPYQIAPSYSALLGHLMHAKSVAQR
ncbi:MAG: PotD/PotF family extracellular solute-binding protein [Proteobacteria bacterium]|nr:PotD/PotF family extracellular solute-binding protein [Pseudomonadota bacterium]